MSALDLLKTFRTNYHTEGVYSTAKMAGARLFRDIPLSRIDRLGYNRGPNIYEFDWDVLIVLDACRADLMEEVYRDYDFVETFDKILSVGSKSQQWLERTFASKYAEEISNTTYISANMFSRRLSSTMFSCLDEVWRTHWDDDLGTVPPRPVTDRAITELRKNMPERLIIHYMQPHYPFINNKMADGINLDYAFYKEGNETNVWSRLKDGEVEKSDVWESYRDNLKLVMDDVKLLLDNADAQDVIITADHGNSFGKLGIYGHPPRPLRCLREVPFIKATGQDGGDYEPNITKPSLRPDEETDISDKLQALGYK